MEKISLSIIEVFTTHIIFTTTPQVESLVKNNIDFYLNEILNEAFSLISLNNGQYKIIPNTVFDIYDNMFLSLKSNYESNMILIYLCKYFDSGLGTFKPNLPNLSSNVYQLNTLQLNSKNLKLVSITLAYCNEISSTLSTFSIPTTTFTTEEDIPLTINLKDVNNSSVPNFKYLINVEFDPNY